MKYKGLLIISAALLIVNCQLSVVNCLAQSAGKEQAIAYTLEDRDRAVRMEERFQSLQKEMNTRFESMDNKFESMLKSMDNKFESMLKSMDDKLDKLYTLIYFVLGGVFGLIGFIMWDRRSYIKPVKEDIRELQSALKDYAKKQPELAEILRSHGLM